MVCLSPGCSWFDEKQKQSVMMLAFSQKAACRGTVLLQLVTSRPAVPYFWNVDEVGDRNFHSNLTRTNNIAHHNNYHNSFIITPTWLMVSINICRRPIRYGLASPGIESRWRWDFRHPCRPALGPSSLVYNGYRVSFPEVKGLGRGVTHPPPCSAEVKDRVELYLYSPSRLSSPVLAWALPLPFCTCRRYFAFCSSYCKL